MEIENASYPKFYPRMHLVVFAPKWYYKGHNDEYSQKVLSSKTKDSMILKRKLISNEKNIILLDDTKATGMTFLEGAKILFEAGADTIQPLCLGINRNPNKFPKN